MHQRKFIYNDVNKNLLYISITDIGDDFKTNFHSHSNTELLLVTKGIGNIITNNNKYLIKEKDLIIINSNTEHYEITNSDCQFMVIGVDKFNGYIQNSLDKNVITISLNNKEYEKILSLYKIIYDDAINTIDDNVISNCFSIIVALLERNINFKFNSIAKTNYSTLVASIVDLIENYHYSNLKLNDLAVRFSISQSTLIHRFKKETGYTIINYKIKCQIEEAKNLLKITNLTITSIASEVGFNDTSHFTKVFKEKEGITPKEYRLQNCK